MFTERRFNTGNVELNFAEGPSNGNELVMLHGISCRSCRLSVFAIISTHWIFAAVVILAGCRAHIPLPTMPPMSLPLLRKTSPNLSIF
jgi:hypothetical protein